MNTVFIDTSVFVALFDEDDSLHEKTIQLLEKVKEKRLKIIITDYIFDECITTVMGRAGHKIAVRAGDFMLNSKVIDLIWLDESIKLKAWDFFRKHSDKEFSFTDCTSFVLMKELKVKHYFAFDDHFKQAGFIEFS